MRGLRTLMLILLAAVFAVGGPLRALPAHADGAPPCHEMAADMGEMAGMTHDKAPAHKPKPDALAMSCCAGCLPAAVRDIAPAAAPGAAVRIAFASLSQAVDGLSPAPEHGPPRPLA
ncbi:hypothetical protein ASD38_06730 [Caulobacter sp. Root487D2Y]|uniref:hypothetical protein n=1 Tax=Caulobacter sp. Root487D2Y TaxID=1736547 RepID=UPI0006F931FF|nr:hypothetical protein [Caulobacter sp. Root487D2Y]KQY31048.1 hypothetical protein ASD38_06730 [Caulobacter sp. Root487D2Y]